MSWYVKWQVALSPGVLKNTHGLAFVKLHCPKETESEVLPLLQEEMSLEAVGGLQDRYPTGHLQEWYGSVERWLLQWNRSRPLNEWVLASLGSVWVDEKLGLMGILSVGTFEILGRNDGDKCILIPSDTQSIAEYKGPRELTLPSMAVGYKPVVPRKVVVPFNQFSIIEAWCVGELKPWWSCEASGVRGL